MNKRDRIGREDPHASALPMALPTADETRQNTVMGDITIRPARPGDARDISRLDIETWRATYAGILSTPYLVGLSERRREAGWRSVILREPRDVRVATDPSGVIIGFGSCGPNRSDRFFAGEVFTLYVAPDWQNQGIGRRLLLTLFRRLVSTGRRSAIVWVLRDNPSRFFYERLGGQQVSRKGLAVGGTSIAAIAYGWRDLPGFLAAVSSEDREPEA
jgi:ribosomal protein S18 acetylase RimI-like enzyme